MAIEQKVELHIAVAIKLAETRIGSKMLVNLDRKPRRIPGHDHRGTTADVMRNLLQCAATQRGIDRRIVDLADEGREPICLVGGHRADNAICARPVRDAEPAIREPGEKTGRSIAAFDEEKTWQPDAGISNIVLA
ncbi:hypothetical protein [Bradyrhizobium nanningense]|uniref:hypothetical protein n=1 Tax=Bradyrhizobium nanningense TaxID=1325118 RepID=UPI001FDEA803|nr:hypothetical protein [Bradyrhizobium nanningense]